MLLSLDVQLLNSFQ